MFHNSKYLLNKKIITAGSVCTDSSVSCRDCLVYGLSPGQPSTVHLAWRLESGTVLFKKGNKCCTFFRVLFKSLKELDSYAFACLHKCRCYLTHWDFFQESCTFIITVMCQMGPFPNLNIGYGEDPIDYPQTGCILRIMLEKTLVNGNSYMRIYFLSGLVLLSSKNFNK